MDQNTANTVAAIMLDEDEAIASTFDRSNTEPATPDLAPELVPVYKVMLDRWASLKQVAGNAAERRAATVAKLIAEDDGKHPDDIGWVSEHARLTSLLAQTKAELAVAKSRADEAVRNAMKNDGSPSNAQLKADREALILTMQGLGLPVDDLVGQSLTGNVMGSHKSASPFYLVKPSNGERSYREISAVASFFGDKLTATLKERLAGKGIDWKSGEAWEVEIAMGNKVARVGHVDVTSEDDTSEDASE